MSAFVHDSTFSQSEGVAAVMQEFALAGYARYVLLQEALAAESGPVAMSADAWAAVLYSDDESVIELLQFCQSQGLLVIEDDGETLSVYSPVIERYDPSQIPQAPTNDTLFTRHEQWADWFINDMAYPPKIANNADCRRYFARWCASRVTVGDMCEAVNVATAQGSGVDVVTLHKHLQALRAQRLKEATECL